MRRTTIIDIARKLNISPSTVSRALRNHQCVTKETKEKVLKVAKQLDYHPDSIAQSLQKKKSNFIGVIVPQVKHFFFAEIMSGITDIAYQAGYTVIICQSNDDHEREAINIQELIRHQVAGMLISISHSDNEKDHFKMIERRDIPIVFFDRVCENIKSSKVIVDDYEGAFRAVEHLILSGYKRIAHLAGYLNISIGHDRLNGYKEALKKHQIPFKKELVVHCGFDEEDGIAGLNKLLEQNNPIPDAIFAVTDPVAIGAFMKIRELNLKIPDDIALVGFSDNPTSSLIDPPLTTVRQPAYEIGKTATELLLNQIENDGREVKPETRILKTELIIRKSS